MNSQNLGYSSQRLSQTLESVAVEGHVRDLACELSVQQVFVNHFDQSIEAVYTFPLPHGAVLLDLSVKIGERNLQGVAMVKQQAETRYEQAITDGDGAIMLEQSDDGICTINLGNLLSGERAVLTYRYAYLLAWQQETVKFRLPTTIAPRYGDPIAAGYQPHQVPIIDNLIERRLSLKLAVEGVLATALFDSPTHEVKVHHRNGTAEIRLSDRQAFMDRDFVLNITSTGQSKSGVQWMADEVAQGYVVLASICPTLSVKSLSGLCLKIVVDCSDSMHGMSIEQAKVGLRRILDNLRPTDSFNVICFGTHVQAYFPCCVSADGRNLRYAREAIENLRANMGGTEMAKALDCAFSMSDDDDTHPTVLLITDGEIAEHRDVIRRADKSGHRVFTVGVGTAVAEAFVRGIADRTGGACELVTPNEKMAESIYRQFCRMYQPRMRSVAIDWPAPPAWQIPAHIGPVFAGDTLHIFAGLRNRPEGQVQLIIQMYDGSEYIEAFTLQLTTANWHALPRIAAAQRIETISVTDQSNAEQLAVKYQLLTRYTHYFILDKRQLEQKSQELPVLVQVPQMLAAGWGGHGIVRDRSAIRDSPFSAIASFSSEFSDAYAKASGYRASCEELLSQEAVDGLLTGLRHDLAIEKSEDDLILSANNTGQSLTGSIDIDELLELLEKAADDWVAVFITDVLPRLDDWLQADFQTLLEQEDWNATEVIAAIVLVIFEYEQRNQMPELKSIFGQRNLTPQLKIIVANARPYPKLIRYFRQTSLWFLKHWVNPGVTKEQFLRSPDHANLINSRRNHIKPKKPKKVTFEEIKKIVDQADRPESNVGH